jgi:hypothetical protein
MALTFEQIPLPLIEDFRQAWDINFCEPVKPFAQGWTDVSKPLAIRDVMKLSAVYYQDGLAFFVKRYLCPFWAKRLFQAHINAQQALQENALGDKIIWPLGFYQDTLIFPFQEGIIPPVKHNHNIPKVLKAALTAQGFFKDPLAPGIADFVDEYNVSAPGRSATVMFGDVFNDSSGVLHKEWGLSEV